MGQVDRSDVCAVCHGSARPDRTSRPDEQFTARREHRAYDRRMRKGRERKPGVHDALAQPGERARRRAALGAPHMVPLERLVAALREQYPGREIPHADPADGGIEARALLLLEAPGPQSVATGFVSRDSPNATARNLRSLLADARIAREAVLVWNVVPWYVGDGRRIRPVDGGDIDEAFAHLETLLALLTRLETIVLLGRKAQQIERRLFAWRDRVDVVHTWHPSPQVFNISPAKKAETRATFAALGDRLSR